MILPIIANAFKKLLSCKHNNWERRKVACYTQLKRIIEEMLLKYQTQGRKIHKKVLKSQIQE